MLMEYHLLAFSLYTLILIYLKQMSQKMFPLQVETEIWRKCKKNNVIQGRSFDLPDKYETFCQIQFRKFYHQNTKISIIAK